MAEASGFLYCMTQRGTACVKFGFTSRTPAERARDGTRGPVPLVVVAAWKSSDARMLEACGTACVKVASIRDRSGDSGRLRIVALSNQTLGKVHK